MLQVKYISSSADIPAGQNYVLVQFGDESTQKKHSRGFTITVPRNKSKIVRDLSFLANIHTAKGLAKRESISEIFACK